MLRYSYNNIVIIVTNVIIFEFLSARFVHALYHFHFFNELEIEGRDTNNEGQ